METSNYTERALFERILNWGSEPLIIDVDVLYRDVNEQYSWFEKLLEIAGPKKNRNLLVSNDVLNQICFDATSYSYSKRLYLVKSIQETVSVVPSSADFDEYIGVKKSAEYLSNIRQAEKDRSSDKSTESVRTRKNPNPLSIPHHYVGAKTPVNELRVLVDTNVFMDENALNYFDNILLPWARNISREHGARMFVVPQEVVRELYTMATLKEVSERKRKAERGLSLIKLLKDNEIVEISSIGQARDKQAADDVFPIAIFHLLLKYNVVLLTQDANLSEMCESQVNIQLNSPSFSGRKRRFASVRMVKGSLVKNAPRKKYVSSEKVKTSSRNKIAKKKANVAAKKYQNKKLKHLNRTLTLSDTEIVGSGDIVVDSEGQGIRLEGAGRIGGEGIVFDIADSSSVLVKRYHSERSEKWRFDKLRFMIREPMQHKSVAWPLDIVTNKEGKEVGFIMYNMKNSQPLAESLFGLSQVKKNFPNWGRKELVETAQSLSALIAKVHSDGAVVGDLNPSNILVTAKKGKPEVGLVDCDSWQIGGFPSPTGMDVYVEPNIRGKDFSDFLRLQRHDNFALAIILFQILFFGRHPYETPGDGPKLLENMVAKNFAFQFRDKKNDADSSGASPVKGAPFKIWTHLSGGVQSRFHSVFALGKNVTAQTWVKVLEKYKEGISDGTLDAFGNSNELVPPAVVVPHRYMDDISETFRCRKPDCEKEETYYGEANIERKRRDKYFLCTSCRSRQNLQNKPGRSRACNKCSKLFSLPIWFEELMRENDVTIPVLCSKHGGLNYQFQCGHCDRKMTPRTYQYWFALSNANPPLCKEHLEQHKQKQELERLQREAQKIAFLCAECGIEFRVQPAFAEKIANKPTHLITCFECMD